MYNKLSIIIPCYNCEKTIKEAVDSCYKQGLNDFELLPMEDDKNEREKDNTIYSIKTSPANSNSNSIPEGYIGTDLNSLGDGKQTRVLVYIILALLPCLLLVPFFLSRDFVPMDPGAM